jgi:alpha-beta hydrolase superfamily lysophospholipase
LRKKGFSVETINLPGHGEAGSEKIRWYSIADYVDAVQAKLESIGRPTVVLGHSLGGYVVQKLMERQPANLAGAVLLAAATQRGVWGLVGRLLASQPLKFLSVCVTRDLYRLVSTPGETRHLFHLESLPEATVNKLWAQLGNESFRAFLDMLILNPIHPEKADPRLPILVLGGGIDGIFPPDIVRRNAQSYREVAQIYPGAPHNLTQNSGWQQVANDLSAWLNQLVSAKR